METEVHVNLHLLNHALQLYHHARDKVSAFVPSATTSTPLSISPTVVVKRVGRSPNSWCIRSTRTTSRAETRTSCSV